MKRDVHAMLQKISILFNVRYRQNSTPLNIRHSGCDEEDEDEEIL